MEKLKTKIEKQYKEILKIPKNKINFYYFVAIHGYIKLIDENEVLDKSDDYSQRDFKRAVEFVFGFIERLPERMGRSRN